VDVNNKAANTAVFMVASLSSLHSPVEPAMRRERYQRAGMCERLAGRNCRAASYRQGLGDPAGAIERVDRMVSRTASMLRFSCRFSRLTGICQARAES